MQKSKDKEFKVGEIYILLPLEQVKGTLQIDRYGQDFESKEGCKYSEEMQHWMQTFYPNGYYFKVISGEWYVPPAKPHIGIIDSSFEKKYCQVYFDCDPWSIVKDFCVQVPTKEILKGLLE